MKKSKLSFVLIAVIVAGVFIFSELGGAGGTAGAVRVKNDGAYDRQVADELVGSVLNAYRDFSVPRFMDIFSDEYSPDRLGLINRISDSYSRIIVVDVDYFIDKVMQNSGILVVTFKWQKKVQQRDIGELVLTEGNATFVFEDQDGVWKLIRIKGQNPLL